MILGYPHLWKPPFPDIFFLAVRSISAAAKEAAAAPSPLSLDPTDDGSAGRCKAGGVV